MMCQVTTEYAGAGDPKRSMELLWGLTDRPTSRPKRGPKPKLTVERIVEVAIGLADAEGVPALSMRRVADQLGVTAMSLYTYVPSKAELIDLMLDTVYGEPARPERVKGGWRARLELIARETWALHLRHPWVLQVAQSRPLLGPNLLAKYEYELAAVDGIGLNELEMEFVITLVNDYVQGAVRGAVVAAQVEQRTGMTDEQWWAAYEPLLVQVFDPQRYPVASRVGPVTGEELGAGDPNRAFEFGLQRVLDGVEALLDRR